MQTSLAEDQLLLSKIIFFRREIVEERHQSSEKHAKMQSKIRAITYNHFI